VVFLLLLALLLALTVPEGAFFRADNGQIVPASPLLSSIVPILFSIFFILGIAYGVGAGVIKSMSDVPTLMAKGLAGSLSFLVVVLTASMFVALFRLSNLDTVISVLGADWLESVNLKGLPLLIMFILLVAFLNLFMMSGSAKWLILAPIFVPMLGRVGFPPALTQVAYRIGDTSTNIICPLSYYLPVVIGLLEQYKPKSDTKVGIGTVISLCVPYSMMYLAVLTIQAVLWYLLRLPLGPGTPIVM
jgi:aminobenzoyl-glutamate transport protein